VDKIVEGSTSICGSEIRENFVETVNRIADFNESLTTFATNKALLLCLAEIPHQLSPATAASRPGEAAR
jgi:hypothetical protein